jgi:hypothetical protein
MAKHLAGVGLDPSSPNAHNAQFPEPSHDVARDVQVRSACPLNQPQPPSACWFCFSFLMAAIASSAPIRSVSKSSADTPALLGLVLCIAHPRRFGQQAPVSARDPSPVRTGRASRDGRALPRQRHLPLAAARFHWSNTRLMAGSELARCSSDGIGE